jgi:putative hemolysin
MSKAQLSPNSYILACERRAPKGKMLTLELGIIAILIVINGLLAMSELAIVSSRPARLAALVEKGASGSRRALVLASDPGKFLSTVQIGITLVGVLSGAVSGATLGLRLTTWLAELGVPQGAAEIIGVGTVVSLITYASLIVGELVPKQIALRNPEAVALKVAPAMTLLAKIASPLVTLLDVSGRALLWLLGHRGKKEEQVTEDEIRTLIVEAENAGVLEPGEKEMIAGVMRLGDRPVGAVMTPRRDVNMIDLSDDVDAIREAFTESPHSRMPAHEGDRDHPLGIVQAKDMLDAYMSGGTPDIRSLVRNAPVIPESADARDVVAILKDSPVHMGLVYDEYGAFKGVVTSADILESIVGGFKTEEGPAEVATVQRDDGSWLISGWMPVDEFADLLGIKLPEIRGFHTVAGFVMHEFGTLPDVGGSFERDGWRFEVVDMDGRRVDKVLAAQLEREETPQAQQQEAALRKSSRKAGAQVK